MTDIQEKDFVFFWPCLENPFTLMNNIFCKNGKGLGQKETPNLLWEKVGEN